MTVNIRSRNETVHTFGTIARALDLIPHQDNLDGYIIVFDKNKPDDNQEAEFYGPQDDFIDFVLGRLNERAYKDSTKPLEDAMTLHGIKLFLLRNWTPEAASAYHKLAGVVYNPNSLVPIGVNGIFTELVELQRKLSTGLERAITAEELHRQYVLNQAAAI